MKGIFGKDVLSSSHLWKSLRLEFFLECLIEFSAASGLMEKMNYNLGFLLLEYVLVNYVFSRFSPKFSNILQEVFIMSLTK